MSKILKVVDGKHYVEGGPECPKCEGDGLYTIWTGGHKIRLRGETGGCWDCDGTGLRAVELWPDARKAEWLNRELDTNLTISGCSYRDRHYGFEVYHEAKSALKPICRLIGFGDDLSQSLTAAVIAVAEEQE